MKNNKLKELILLAYNHKDENELLGIIYTRFDQYDIKNINNINLFLMFHHPELIYLKSTKTNIEAGLYNEDMKEIKENKNSIQIDLRCNRKLVFGY